MWSVQAMNGIKKKGTRCSTLTNEHYVIYRGVEKNVHAQAGMAVVLRKDYWNEIINSETINKRLLRIYSDKANNQWLSLFICYGPSKNE